LSQIPTNIACDPTKWPPNTWIHIQIFGHGDASDNWTYNTVGVDEGQGEVFTAFDNASGPTGRALGWNPKGDLVTNFQIDGTLSGNGSATVYTHKMTMYRW
jgi:hypothetical protein